MSRLDELIAELCPDGVEYKTLSQVLTIKNGSDYKGFGSGKIPVYGTGGIMTHIDRAAFEKPSVLIPRKGSLNKLGIESFFSTVVATKRIELKKLSPFIENNSLLNITPEDEALGWKYVYQCKLTKDTINERIRSPLGMWSQQETYIDADIQLVLNRLKEYYA